MVVYLTSDVWPGIPLTRMHVLHSVLHNPPFRARTPTDLRSLPAQACEAVLPRTSEELVRRGMPPLADEEVLLWRQYVASRPRRTGVRLSGSGSGGGEGGSGSGGGSGVSGGGFDSSGEGEPATKTKRTSC
jgi:uncharacterized membrane protein YgcG